MRLKETKYLFIDGAYLRRVAKTISDVYYPNIDIIKLIDFHKICYGYTKTFYYDCLPLKQKDETQEDYKMRFNKEIEFYNSLEMVPGLHVFKGVLKKKSNKVVQKGVDINIAVDMLMHTINGNMDKATLLTGDSDFIPLLEALLKQGMYVNLLFYPKYTSKDLIYKADSKAVINSNYFFDRLKIEPRKIYKIPSVWIGGNITSDSTIIGKLDSVSKSVRDSLIQDKNSVYHSYSDNKHTVSYYFQSYFNGPSIYNYSSNNLDFIKKRIVENGYNVSWIESIPESTSEGK